MSMCVRFGIVCLCLLAAGRAATVVDEYPVAPALGGDFMASSEDHDAFENCPVYPVKYVTQMALYNDWAGPEDFSAQGRFAWDETTFYCRIDVVDDNPVAVPEGEGGDTIAVRLAALTCGPMRAERPSLKQRDAINCDTVLLQPDPANDACRVTLKCRKPECLGAVKAKLFRTLDGYSVLLALPLGAWEDPPRFNSTVRFQVNFADVDATEEPTQVSHRFMLFPVENRRPGATSNVLDFGRLKFVGKRWVRITPAKVVFTENTVDLNLSVGNFEREEVAAEIVVEDAKTGKEIPGLAVSRPVASGVRDVSEVKLDLSDLPAGGYRLKARAGVYFDTGQVLVNKAEGGLCYCPRLLERRGPDPQHRDLPAAGKQAAAKETIRYLAGGGTVLWQAGEYDASSAEFPEILRALGPQELLIPTATAADVPWALFGGQDNLDGMREPLTIKIDRDFVKAAKPLLPDDYAYGDRYKKQKLGKTKQLLLVGVVTEYESDDTAPELQVATGDEILLKQRLLPSKQSEPGSRHSYVIRVWLDGREGEIQLTNSSAYGARLELDFLALIGGGPGTTAEADAGSLEFDGDPEAVLFSRQLATSLYLMRHYLVDRGGKSYSSLPGGRYGETETADYGQLMEELAQWNCLREARALSSQATRVMKGFRGYRRSTGVFQLGHATVITGMYHVWRKLGEPQDFLSRDLWMDAVHRPITSLVQEITTNPLGLADTRGKYGVNGDAPGATVPMYFASQAALRNAITMASRSAYGEASSRWRSVSDDFAGKFAANLVTSNNRFRIADSQIYPASWTLPAQSVVALLPPRCWIYGRYENRKPVLYDSGTRVFDTPYLLAGVGFWVDHAGFSFSDNMEAQLRASYDYIVSFSPVVVDNELWRDTGVLDYKSSVLQLWLAQSALMLDNLPAAAKMIDAYIKYTFDEGVPLREKPPRADIEISPFTFEEKLNVSADGENQGASGDDLNVQNGVNALKLARIIAGIDDYDSSELKLLPRLPASWNTVRARNWVIRHDFPRAKKATVSYLYERLSANRYQLTLKAPEPLSSVTVRVGPFNPRIRKVRLTTGGRSENVPVVRIGAAAWASKTYRDVERLELSAQASMY